MLEILLYAGRAIMPLLLTMALGCWLRHSAHWSDDFTGSSTASAFMCCCRCSCF